MNETRDIERGTPSEEQLILILENLFDKQRLIELANRCSTKSEDIDLRQVRTHELIDILVQAWRVGPKSSTGSLWGAVDQELVIRQRNYLGLGESRVVEMLSSLESEGAYDRKTAATLLWVLLHERYDDLLRQHESLLSTRYRDSGGSLVARTQQVKKMNQVIERVEQLGEEIREMLEKQGRQLDRIEKRLEIVETGRKGLFGQPLPDRSKHLIHEEIRVGVFVDVQNMFYAAKKLDGARINYDLMLDRIVSGRRLIKAVAYIVESSEIDQSGFISVLEKKGYQVRRKELKSFMDGSAKGDWDMGMAIDMIESASELDVVALVSGDGDFVSLVRLIKRIGPRVELFAFAHNLSTELKESSDEFVEISENLLLKNHHHMTNVNVREHPAEHKPENPGTEHESSGSGPGEGQ